MMADPRMTDTAAPRPLAFARLAVAIGPLLFLAGTILWRLAPATDDRLYTLLHADVGAHWLPLLIHFTDAGGAAVMIPVALCAFIYLMLEKRWPMALWLFATIAAGRILVEFAKFACARARPPMGDRLVAVSSASFPSSHSAGTMLTLGALCVAFGAGRRGWTAAILFALAIGFSRIALGVHWPSDVLGGWGLGLLWVGLLARFTPRAG